MHRELLDALSVITEEEQRILDEQRGIDPQLYTEKKELIVDSEKLLKKGKLIQVPSSFLAVFLKNSNRAIPALQSLAVDFFIPRCSALKLLL